METRRGSSVRAKPEAKRKSFESQMDSAALKNNICRTISIAKRKAKKKRDLKRKEASRRATLVKVNLTCSKKKVSTLSRMVPCTADSGSAASVTALVNRHGQMEHAMKANGRTIRPMDVAFSTMLMVTSSMENGAVIRLTASAPIIMLTGRSMRAAGSMIYRMEVEKRPGRTALSTKDFIVKVSSMVKAATFGAMEACIWENG